MKTDFIDLYFIYSDLFEVDVDESEKLETAERDAGTSVEYSIRNGHVYDDSGECLGPIGKACI